MPALSRELHEHNGNRVPQYLVERLLLDVNGHVEHSLAGKASPGLNQHLIQARDRLAQAGFRVPTGEAKVRMRPSAGSWRALCGTRRSGLRQRATASTIF